MLAKIKKPDAAWVPSLSFHVVVMEDEELAVATNEVGWLEGSGKGPPPDVPINSILSIAISSSPEFK